MAIRQSGEAVVQCQVNVQADARSAHALGGDLFGRHAGPTTLAGTRKAVLADAWADKQTRRAKQR